MTLELLTSVISGNRSLEIRVFAEEFLSVQEEQILTRGLCRLMNRAYATWKRYKKFFANSNIIDMFRLTLVYIDDLDSMPFYQRLRRLLEPYKLTILMVDCSQPRFIDVHCYCFKAE